MTWTEQTNVETTYTTSAHTTTSWDQSISSDSAWTPQGAPELVITRTVIGTPIGLLLSLTYASQLIISTRGTNGYVDWDQVTDSITSWT